MSRCIELSGMHFLDSKLTWTDGWIARKLTYFEKSIFVFISGHLRFNDPAALSPGHGTQLSYKRLQMIIVVQQSCQQSHLTKSRRRCY